MKMLAIAGLLSTLTLISAHAAEDAKDCEVQKAPSSGFHIRINGLKFITVGSSSTVYAEDFKRVAEALKNLKDAGACTTVKLVAE